MQCLYYISDFRFFPSDRYIKNRCSGADGVLIDFEKKEDKVDDYKLSSFHRLKNR